MFDFETVEKKLFTLTGATTYKELAKELDMTHNAYSGVRHRKKIPYESIIKYAIKHNIDANTIFGEKKERYRTIPRRELKNTDTNPFHVVGYYTQPDQLTKRTQTYDTLMLIPKSTPLPASPPPFSR